MKIIEVRDGFIKFEADKSIYLSSFVKIAGMSKNYIAQVTQLKTLGEIILATAKILFISENNELKNYDKTEPSKDAEIEAFTSDILNNSITAKKPVIVGKTLDNACNIKIDASAFNKKMLISIDDKNINNTMIRNFSKQFENLGMKTIVLDTYDAINAKKYKAGIDFKLPLDTSSLAFMYESCLNDATSESKSTIVEIFKDLSEYSKTVPFVPFGTLKTIVDDMVDKQHVFKLLILKNKLAKFEKLGYFASSINEVDNLEKILNQKCAIIDLSGMDILFQNKYLSYIYEKLNKSDKVQVFLEASNTVSKKNLKNIISDSDIPATIITHSKFQYLNDIKNMFDNFIIEPTLANNSLFQVYSTFLGSMKKGMYLIAGEATNYIPMVSETQIIEDLVPYNSEDAEIQPSDEIIENKEDDAAIENIADYEDETDSNAVIENDEDITEISIEEDEESAEEILSKDEIIASIDEKSESAIASIAESLEEHEELDVFDDTDEEDIQVNENENKYDIEDEAQELETIEQNEALNEIDNGIQEEEDTIQESENSDLQDEELISDLADVNEESINISEIPNEEIQVEEEEINQDILEEELSEEMLEENVDDTVLEQELIAEEDNSELVESEMEDFSENNAQESSLDINLDETTIELDSDAEILLQEDGSSEDVEELPNNTTLDVDFSEPKIMPLTGEVLSHDFDEIVELDPADSTDDDIIVDMSDDEQINIEESREQEILEEVDKVYTTMKEGNSDLEEISDSDLDLIDELNNDEDELEEYHGELEEISDADNEGILDEVHPEPKQKKNDASEILEHKESTTPIVPMYDADIPQEDMVMSDPIQQGDAVLHAKYGNGVVEKMIKYGNKTLYAINFENIGRRLLDPTLTEIKRV